MSKAMFRLLCSHCSSVLVMRGDWSLCVPILSGVSAGVFRMLRVCLTVCVFCAFLFCCCLMVNNDVCNYFNCLPKLMYFSGSLAAMMYMPVTHNQRGFDSLKTCLWLVYFCFIFPATTCLTTTNFSWSQLRYVEVLFIGNVICIYCSMFARGDQKLLALHTLINKMVKITSWVRIIKY